MNRMRASMLRKNREATVTALTGGKKARQRLMRMGFVPGAVVVCQSGGTADSPAAYRVGDCLVALSHRDARRVICKENKPEKQGAQAR